MRSKRESDRLRRSRRLFGDFKWRYFLQSCIISKLLIDKIYSKNERKKERKKTST